MRRNRRRWAVVAARCLVGPAVAAAVVCGAVAEGAAASMDIKATCADADRALADGEVDFAVGLFGSGTGALSSDECVARVLHKAAENRQTAREDAAKGQQALLIGHLRPAQDYFTQALAVDNANAVAQQGLSQLARLRASDSPPGFDWDTFYADRVEPAYRVVGAFLLAVIGLFMASALVSRWVVGVHAQAWPKAHRTFSRYLGGVLLLGVAAFLPVYPMFQPFTEKDVVPRWCVGVVLGVVAAFGLAWTCAYCCATKGLSRKDRPWARRRFLKDWWPPPVWIGMIIAAGGLSWVFDDAAYPRLLTTYAVLIGLAVVITAASFGQNCRLQVAAITADGSADAASTDYVLNRLQTLGMERPRGLAAAGVANVNTSISSLQSQDISGLPSGPLIGAVARIVFALRPDLTWRAQVTLVDDNRVAIRLSRIGRLAYTGVFSRSDADLAPLPPPPPPGQNAPTETEAAAVDRARAQLLTGAAVYILVQLSIAHPDLRVGLCGATQWRSVALHVIGSSQSLSHGEDALALLRTAVNLDPDNATARYQYISRLEGQLAKQPYDAMLLAMYKNLKSRTGNSADDRLPKSGSESLYLESLYLASAAALDRCARMNRSGSLTKDSLRDAKSFVHPLVQNCERLSADWTAVPEDNTAATARALLPLAKNLQSIAERLESLGAVEGGAQAPTTTPDFDSPTLAYNHACLEALSVTATNRKAIDTVLTDLAFAVSTASTRKMAQDDEYLATMRDDPGFIGLLAEPPQPAHQAGRSQPPEGGG